MRAFASLLILLLSAVSCATAPAPDYTEFRTLRPASILVLPPVNNSIDVGAAHGYLSIISKPIAERGFYVFPVAVVESYFKSQGLSEPAEIHNIPPKKLQEIFGADAIFYVTIEEWGNKYQLITSTTKVEATGVLVDAGSGTELWRGTHKAQSSSGSSGNSVGSILAEAALSQIVKELTDETRDLARSTSDHYIMGPAGFIEGPFLLLTK
ncbi:MAG: DUF799 domain-containing protein [Pseudobdellovibrionaceae bacterium]|nr:DUF799 domain-containing protein [Pseudobdellovibrionaceae bacterium]